MAKIVWTEPAYLDLDEIAEYIALDKISAAAKLVDKIITKVTRLADYPESGRVPPELRGSKYREIIVKPCRIFYFIEEDTAFIIHIMRSERQLRQYMLEDVVHED